MLILILMSGLMAGIYFTFSVFVMRALGELPPVQGAQAMNRINDVIVKPLFLPLFVVSSIGMAALLVWSFIDPEPGISVPAATAAAIYLAGMTGVTAFGNVPLNNRLLRLAGEHQSLADYWHDYQPAWNRLNHIRTLSCLISCVLLMLSTG